MATPIANQPNTQTLLLGLGGTGSRIVNYVAADLRKKNISINDGTICCAVLDTNDNDRQKLMDTGVGIPVIPTSKDRIVSDYLKMYGPKGVREWMPESPALLKESMKDGASQMRPKSRLAFMDILEDHTIRELEQQIEKLFDKRDNAKIRVMVVSSLAGGTGSGMFIQTALWLRKYFEKRKCAITIRGIFVLPDVFINTIQDIRTDNTEIQSLYANAYGAIRELNAITKIKTKGMVPLSPVKIDSLFDSEKGQPDGQPVFDYAFFIDDISEGGSVLSQIDHYEQVAARLVYMQLYAPMHDDLYSEEDNLFKRFQKCEEPVFGSCGTAKAVYPGDDILRYCALRAARDSLSAGWRRLDMAIKEKQRKEDEKEKNGVVLTHRIDPRTEYVRLFDAEAAKTGEQIGKDRLFANIANDVKNEEIIPGDDGHVEINYTDKVQDFLDKLEEILATVVDTADPGALSGLKLKPSWVKQASDTRETLLSLVEKKTKAVSRFIEDADSEVDALAEEVLDRIFTSDMGDVNMENAESIFGMLTKKNRNGETYFVHPVAVRYLLYKLAAKLDELKGSIVLDTLRQCAERGYGNGKPKISFDNAKTAKEEDSPVSYLKSKGFLQNEDKFLQTFKNLYAQHNAGQFELCRAYAIAALKLRVAILISKRLEKLTACVEGFFYNLVKVSNTIEDALAENIRKNNTIAQKVIYVCASEEEKAALYHDLRLDTNNSDAAVNKIVVNALYGQFCAQESAMAENNKPYVGKSVETIFFREIIGAYSDSIRSKHGEEIDMDIYTAICRSMDIADEKKSEDRYEAESDRLDVDLETGESRGDGRHRRHVEAMADMKDRLFKLASPFLIHDEEYEDIPEDADDMTPTQKDKTFWGLHPIVAAKCPELARILGVNLKLQENSGYAKNELDCYRAVYGIQAAHVQKFNELKDGDYFRCYQQVVNSMLAGGPEDLIHTPHLDKTWHLFLPYITPAKQVAEDAKFYRMFWLAVAYGMISLGKDGKYHITKTKKTATGSYDQDELILYAGEPVGKADVLLLLAALKLDGTFLMNAARLEKQFELECGQTSYEGTKFLRGETIDKAQVGGLASKAETNAMTLIVRYQNSTRHDNDVTAMLIQGLELLCQDLVRNNYERNETAKIQLKALELCKRIYTASTMKDKDIDLIRHWKAAWAKKGSED